MLAKMTPNFSGAEIVGLINNATTRALDRTIKMGKQIKMEDMNFNVTMQDFDASYSEIKPAYGSDDLSFYDDKYFEDHRDEIIRISTDIFSRTINNTPYTMWIKYKSDDKSYDAIKYANCILKVSPFGYKKIYNTNKHLISENRLIPVNNFFEESKRSVQSILLFDKLQELLEIVDGTLYNTRLLSLIKSQLKSYYNNQTVIVFVSQDNDIIKRNLNFDQIIDIG
jgi:vesicle-fusing ATPase